MRYRVKNDKKLVILPGGRNHSRASQNSSSSEGEIKNNQHAESDLETIPRVKWEASNIIVFCIEAGFKWKLLLLESCLVGKLFLLLREKARSAVRHRWYFWVCYLVKILSFAILAFFLI